MTILRIEHNVANFDGWKKAFESDPIDRKKSGVINYRIFRLVNYPNFVLVDLEFETVKEAEDALVKLRSLWGKVEGTIVLKPQTSIMELIEAKQL